MGINGVAVNGDHHNMLSVRVRIADIDYGYDGVEFLISTPLVEIEKFCVSIVEQLTLRETVPWFNPSGLKRGKVKTTV